jgi:hypothetical protein
MGELTVSNVERICVLKCISNIDFEREISFLAEHFEELKSTLPSELLAYVLNSPSLRVTDEESLFAFVAGLIDNDHVNICLLSAILCEYLSDESLRRYVSLLDESSPDLISSLWFRLREVLLHRTRLSLDRPDRWTMVRARFEMKSDSAVDGILAHLRQIVGGDVFKAVEITAAHTNPDRYGSSVNGGSPAVVADFSSDLGWYDQNRAPSWLMFGFKERQVSVAGYMIKFGKSTSGTQRWVLAGSNDSNHWTIIDDRSRESKSHREYDVDRFECHGDTTSTFRWIRIELAKPYWGDFYYLGLASIEFFGDLCDSIGKSQGGV